MACYEGVAERIVAAKHLLAGMDSVIGKPLEMVDPIEALLDTYNKSGRSSTAAYKELDESSHFDFDSMSLEELEKFVLSCLKNNFRGDRNLRQKSINILKKETPIRLENLKIAIEKMDFTEIRSEAHFLRGLVVHFSGQLVVGQTKEIESSAKARDSRPMDELIKVVDSNLNKLLNVVDKVSSEIP